MLPRRPFAQRLRRTPATTRQAQAECPKGKPATHARRLEAAAEHRCGKSGSIGQQRWRAIPSIPYPLASPFHPVGLRRCRWTAMMSASPTGLRGGHRDREQHEHHPGRRLRIRAVRQNAMKFRFAAVSISSIPPAPGWRCARERAREADPNNRATPPIALERGHDSPRSSPARLAQRQHQPPRSLPP